MSADTTQSNRAYGASSAATSGSSFQGSNQSTPSPLSQMKDNVADALDRGRSGIAESAYAASDSMAEDMSKLRADMASMQQTMTKFMTEAGGEAAKTARNVGQAVASQVSAAASDAVDAGSEMASQAKEQIKTFASELENMARKSPLGALAATLVVGVVIGMMSRGRG